jgi:hypothetical protein
VITPDHVSIGGYPFAFALKITGASLAWPDGLGFAPAIIKLRAHPWSVGKILVSVTGGYTVTLPPGATRPPLTAAGETIRGTVKFADGPVPLALSLKSDTVSVAQTGADAAAARELTIASLDVTASRPEAPPQSDMDVALELSITALDLSAAGIETNPLGGAIKEAHIQAQWLGLVPATPDADGLKAWRDAGGTINAPVLEMQWGPLGVSGGGTIALDHDMQPEGAFTARITGFNAAIDALSAAGWIKMGPASLAKLGLGIAARPGPDGKPMVTTPMTIQDRHISLGAFRLGQLPLLKLD